MQGEVFERAKKAKEKAALEALGKEGVNLMPTAISANDGAPVDQPNSSGTRSGNGLSQEMINE